MAHIKKQYTLDDIVLYPDEYGGYGPQGLVPVIMKDGIPYCLSSKILESLLAEAIIRLQES